MKNYKIICLDKGKQIPRIVKAVFNSIPFSLEVVKSATLADQLVQQGQYDLFIVNEKSIPLSDKQIRKINMSCVGTDLVIVEKDAKGLEFWLDIPDIKVLTDEDISQKLPLFLGELYSRNQNKFYDSFLLLELLKEGLRKAEGIFIIVDAECRITFLNETAQNLLGLEEQDTLGNLLSDQLVDGNKVWNFILNEINNNQNRMVAYQFKFIDRYNEEKPREVSIKSLGEFSRYFLIQSADGKAQAVSTSHRDEYQLLNKFADSIANELINPVNIIYGRLQLLQAVSGQDEKTQKSLDILEKQVNRINEIMSKLLTFAHLKQDTIPQKINMNEIFRQILRDPAVVQILETRMINLHYDLKEPLLVLNGLISHFEVLFKMLLEISCSCLDNNGLIFVETNQLSSYLNREWVNFKLTIDYTQSNLKKDVCLQAYLGESRSEIKSKSIEATIIEHIIGHYQGIYEMSRDDELKREIVSILFPIS